MRTSTCFALLLIAAAANGQAESGTRLLRFPDIHADRVVFTHAGDLWTVPANGGAATRLTASTGLELFAKFSPDGRWIAFTGEYDGDQQVYVMPATGGEPRQLTFYPARGPLLPRQGHDNQVHGWSPDGHFVLVHSMRDSAFITEPRLYQVPFAGGAATVLPMPVAGAGEYSPDGKRILYSPRYNEFRPWKRYQGGWARDLWIYDLASGRSRNVTADSRSDGDPMWTAQGIFFVSDRSSRANLYSLDEPTGATRMLTSHSAADVGFASADATSGRIVYELDGQLHVFDPATREDRALDIRVPADYPQARPEAIGVADRIEQSELSPNAKRVLVVARGDIFSIPVGEGVSRNLTHSSNAHDREATWSPDSARLAFISDASGEEELWVATDGASSEPKQVTRGHATRWYRPRWSPDAARVAMSDKDGAIHVIDMASGAATRVGSSGAWFSRDFEWSPDGRYLAYTELQSTFFGVICVWDRVTGSTHRVTDPMFNSSSPAWDPAGPYLFLLSDREPMPLIDGIEWNYAVDRSTAIYALALRKDIGHPFPVLKDEKPAEQPAAPAQPIDFDGINARIARAPLSADNYGSFVVTKTRLIYDKRPPRRFESDGSKPSLVSWSRADREEKVVNDRADFWSVADDGQILTGRFENRMLRDFRVLHDANKPVEIDAGSLRMRREPRAEWNTVFAEVWRRYRDYFYVEGMNAQDWAALRRRYSALLPHVHHRSDLTYVIGELIGELDISHAYFAGPDASPPAQSRTGLLGARLELDQRAGRYRFTDILNGDNSDTRYRSPLTEIGADVRAGDFLLAINGTPLRPDLDPYALLRGTAGQPVELVVSRSPQQDPRRMVIRALESEAPLLYWNWVARNRQAISKLSHARIGYVHIPNMGAAGLREFIKGYYGQIRADGLIVDVRYNDGGNASRMILDRLTRRHYGIGYVRGVEHPATYPWGNYTHVFTGKQALLINETTKSDGEAMAWAFRDAQLGPIIGNRTWGGTVGTGDSGPLLDGSSVGVPQYQLADRSGASIVEGTGVLPDIEVENDATSQVSGHDLQLERAVTELLRAIEGTPGKLPSRH
jgi:tricorn protease